MTAPTWGSIRRCSPRRWPIWSRRGVVTGRFKTLNRGKTVFTFAMGDREMYQYLDNNIVHRELSGRLRERSALISHNDNVVSVNSTIEMDLTGACNRNISSGHQYSAAGGQLTSFAVRTPRGAANQS